MLARLLPTAFKNKLKQPRLKTVCKEKSTGIGSRCRAAWTSSLVGTWGHIFGYCSTHAKNLGLRVSLRWSVWMILSPVKRSNGDLVVAKQDMSGRSLYNPHGHLLKNQCATESFGEEMRLEEDTSQQMKVTKKTKAPWIALSMCYLLTAFSWADTWAVFDDTVN